MNNLPTWGIPARSRWRPNLAFWSGRDPILKERIRVRNAGPPAASLHLLAHLWFRNRWPWGDHGQRPELRAAAGPADPALL